MTDRFLPIMRAIVAVTLLLATATLMLVAVNTARAAGALAIGSYGAFGEGPDFRTIGEARQIAPVRCHDDDRVVTVTMRGSAALAVDFCNACGAHGRGKAG